MISGKVVLVSAISFVFVIATQKDAASIGANREREVSL